ncbi:MAG TPA: alpha-amylase family glycosyl hydrolase [Rectinemataceae bacterium]|nr:alpha-amylase family glycosyl hydrolase [Rectinemataceae bacterium]
MIDESSAIYQIFLRNFTHEGTFAVAIPRLAGVAAMGFDWICLTPIHPIGVESRKGKLGSPYAISDYRAIDPSLGTMGDFRTFLAAAHGLGLKVMMDVVFNHTSPDSVLARENPEWFLREGAAGASATAAAASLEMMHGLRAPGALGHKCADWSDVVDLDYGSSPQLWVELMSILVGWREEGVDGFRCDVASLVPVDFWKQARQRVNQYDPGLRRERYPLVWLAESVHPGFLKKMREAGHGAWSEPELHSVFDLSYDYDGWERLEKVWAGERDATEYLDYLYTQETLYPARARKIRFLENHDQMRAPARFGRGRITRDGGEARLKAWTLFTQFIPGITFAYMGQECAIARKPDLFEKDPVDWAAGDESFRDYFIGVLAACKKAKAVSPRFSWTEVGKGVFLLERSAATGAGIGTEASAAPGAAPGTTRFAVLVNLEGWTSELEFPRPLRGRDLLSGDVLSLEDGMISPEKPIFLEIDA